MKLILVIVSIIVLVSCPGNAHAQQGTPPNPVDQANAQAAAAASAAQAAYAQAQSANAAAQAAIARSQAANASAAAAARAAEAARQNSLRLQAQAATDAANAATVAAAQAQVAAVQAASQARDALQQSAFAAQSASTAQAGLISALNTLRKANADLVYQATLAGLQRDDALMERDATATRMNVERGNAAVEHSKLTLLLAVTLAGLVVALAYACINLFRLQRALAVQPAQPVDNLRQAGSFASRSLIEGTITSARVPPINYSDDRRTYESYAEQFNNA